MIGPTAAARWPGQCKTYEKKQEFDKNELLAHEKTKANRWSKQRKTKENMKKHVFLVFLTLFIYFLSFFIVFPLVFVREGFPKIPSKYP